MPEQPVYGAAKSGGHHSRVPRDAKARKEDVKTMMKWLSGVALTLSVFSAQAAPVLVTATLESTANAEPRSGVSAGFYELSIDGVSTLAMCDDFYTHISVGHSWSGYVMSYDDIQAGEGKFNPGNVDKYSQAGYLISLSNSMSHSEQADMNLAIWNIFAPGSVTMTGVAQSLYDDATSGAFDSFDWSGVMQVLTPDPYNVSQEFLMPFQVPVPGTLVLLGLGLAGLGCSARARR